MKKATKILAGGGLALMFGLGTLFGVLVAPMNSTHATTSGSEENLLTPQEKLYAGTGLGLDPENDPVIFKTDKGLEIKYGGAALTSGTSTITSLSGYAYVTMGGTNWIIIGQSSTTSGNYSIHTYYKDWATSSYVEKQTDAGNAIWTATNHVDYGTLHNGISGTTINFPNAVKSSELKAGELLCFSEGCLTKMAFNNSTYIADYVNGGGELKKYIDDIYKTLSDYEQNFVKNLVIKTAWYDGSSYNILSTNAYFFPLATLTGGYDGDMSNNAIYKQQNFLIESYLGKDDDSAENTKRKIAYYSQQATQYWLRTGYKSMKSYAYTIYQNGQHSAQGCTGSYGVRPAFVLQL